MLYKELFVERKPLVDNLCDDCKIELVRRNDDNEDSFKIRYDSYMKEANLIIDYYKEKGILKTVLVEKLDNTLESVLKEVKND